jgi:F5/8 type C domain.
MRNLIALVLLGSLAAACSPKHETSTTVSQTAPPPSTSSTVATTTTAATSTTVPSHSDENLVALASGAVVVQKASAADSNGESWFLFDEDPSTGWTSGTKQWSEPTVVELPDRSVIKVVQFDTAHDEYDGRVPDEVEVAVSDQGPKTGFQPIAKVTLSRELKDGQTFPVTASIPGRWVRLQVTKKEGGSEIAQIEEFRAFGERETHNESPNVTGTWDTGAGIIHLKQDGLTVSGCFETGGFPISGGMEGRLMKFPLAPR